MNNAESLAKALEALIEIYDLPECFGGHAIGIAGRALKEITATNTDDKSYEWLRDYVSPLTFEWLTSKQN